jgi:hypothetical protein
MRSFVLQDSRGDKHFKGLFGSQSEITMPTVCSPCLGCGTPCHEKLLFGLRKRNDRRHNFLFTKLRHSCGVDFRHCDLGTTVGGYGHM